MTRPAPRVKFWATRDRLYVKIPYEDREVAKRAGARWDRQQRAWYLPRDGGFADLLKNELSEAGLWDGDLPDGVSLPRRVVPESTAPAPPRGMTYAPWLHQAEAFSFAGARDGAMLNLAPGTGKTKVAVDLMVARGAQAVLVLCPLAVIEDVWVPQVLEHRGEHDLRPVGLARGSVRKKTERAKEHVEFAQRSGGCAIVAINYESSRREPFASWALSGSWDAVILDESHRVKAPQGQTSRFVRRLARLAEWRLALTGTPAPHSPLDLWAQLDAIAPGVLPATFHAFRDRYAVLGGFEGRQVVSFKNLDGLAERADQVTFKAGNEVLDLPEAIHQRRGFDLPPKARRAYDSLERDFYAYLEHGEGSGEVSVRNALEKVLRLQQFTGGWAKHDDRDELVQLHHAKEVALREVLEDLPPDEPVVVFCRFRCDLDSTRSAAGDLGRETYELSGARRELAAWKEQTDGSVLAAQIQAGGVGVDLTRARYVVYFSVGYSLGDYLQSLARVHRPGQDRSVVYYHLLGRQTIDEKVYGALSKRQSVVERVIGELGVGYDTGLVERP